MEQQIMIDWSYWKGKRVRLRSKPNNTYSGLVKGVDSNFLQIIDKFDNLVIIAFSEILEIREEN